MRNDSIFKASLAFSIIAVTFALYFPSMSYVPVSFDDPVFITHNPLLHEGLSLDTFRRCFTELHGDEKMYVPILWLSYLLDTGLLGASPDAPWGYRFTSNLLHAINTAILFLLLTPLCKSRWAAFAAAAFWAWHPLRVESVAWLSLRKDVLSGFFALLTIAFYALAQRKFHGNSGLKRVWPHCLLIGLSLVAFVLGLLSKPMVVTIPFVLLLLDVWPLQRAQWTIVSFRKTIPHLLMEKWAFFGLAVFAAIGVYHTQTHAIGGLPFWYRLYYLPANYWFYLQKTVLPLGLHPMVERAALPPASFLLLIALLGIITFWLWTNREIAPHAWIGWLLFAGVLFPVSGIVAIGAYPVADRYSYLPAIGFSLIILSAIPDRNRYVGTIAKWTACFVSTIFLVMLLILTSLHLPSWRNDHAMYANIERYHPDHYSAAHYQARVAIFTQGDFDKANQLADRMLQQRPGRTLGLSLKILSLSQIESIQSSFELALDNYPPLDTHSYPGVYELELAIVAFLAKDFDTATKFIDMAVALSKYEAETQQQLHAIAMLIAHHQGDHETALTHAHQIRTLKQRRILRQEDLAIAYYTLWSRGYFRQTLPKFRDLIAAYPQRADLINNIAWILATTAGSPAPAEEIIDMAEKALRIQPGHPVILNTLSVAHANAGDFEKAIELSNRVIELLEQSRDPTAGQLQEAVKGRVSLFSEGIPYREQAVRRILYSP